MGTPVADVPGVTSVGDAWKAARDKVRETDPGRGLRLTFTVVGEEATTPEKVRAYELPVEALYDSLRYLGIDPLTPIARGLQSEPDLPAVEVDGPLRILVVVSTPTGKPTAHADREEQVIRDALREYVYPGGPFELKIGHKPTRKRLGDWIKEGYHVLHFIGHGGFGPLGNDPTPRGTSACTRMMTRATRSARRHCWRSC